MAHGQRSNTPLVPQALRALDQLKYEAVQELGIKTVTGVRCTGAIGGYITMKLVALAEQQLTSK